MIFLFIGVIFIIMKRIYFYSKEGKPLVVSEGCEVEVKLFCLSWFYFESDLVNFVLKFLQNEQILKIEGKGEFAFFMGQVYKLKTCHFKHLLITDKPFCVRDNYQGQETYETWIQFWIEKYQFNGSKIVYIIDESIENSHIYNDTIYKPDMIISKTEKKIYSFNSDQSLVIQKSFCPDSQQSFDSKILLSRLESKYDFITNPKCGTNNIIFELENDKECFIDDIKIYLKNIEFECKLFINRDLIPDRIVFEVYSVDKFLRLAVQCSQQILSFADPETIISIHSPSNFPLFKLDARKIIPLNSSQSFYAWIKPEKHKFLLFSSYSYPESIKFYLTSGPLSTVFVYSQNPQQQVIINSEQVPVSRFKSKWLVFTTTSPIFYIKVGDLKKKFKIPKPGRYALYRNKLIEIKHNLNKLLFVTDLDNTIFNKSSQGIKYYRMFIEHWIEYFEFNGSFLAYNTGRDLKGFMADEKKLFLADLHFFCLGTFAYIINEDMDLIPDPDFPSFFESFQTNDWDSQIFADALLNAFNLPQDCLRVLYPSYFLLKVSSDIAETFWEPIKSFIQNKEGNEFSSRRIYGKAKLLTFKSETLRLVEVVPKYAGKKIGVRYSQQKFGFSTEKTVTAGDSLNDTDLLKIGGLGIVMINSEQLLLDWVGKKTRKNLILSSEIYGLGLLKEFEKMVSRIK